MHVVNAFGEADVFWQVPVLVILVSLPVFAQVFLHPLHGYSAHQSVTALAFNRRRGSEEGDDRISFVLVEGSLVLILDDVCHRGQVIV